jgi:hypothetical protein
VADLLPEYTSGEIDAALNDVSTASGTGISEGIHHTPTLPTGSDIWTLPNRFGIVRRYFATPSSIPDGERLLIDAVDDLEGEQSLVDAALSLEDNQSVGASGAPTPLHGPSLLTQIQEIIYPHPHLSAYLLNRWFYRPGATKKSKLDRDILVKEVLLNPAFDPKELAPPFSFNTLDDLLLKSADGNGDPMLPVGWKQRDVVIDIPPTAHQPRTTWKIAGLYIRDILQVAKDVAEGPSGRKFNWDGFEEWWKPESVSTPPQRLYHNTYSSDEFLHAEAELRRTEPVGYTGPPRRVLGLMFWSDSTQLSTFGQASLHPIYLGFANQDKYDRCHPSKRALQHVAYVPKVSKTCIYARFLTNHAASK